MGHVTYVMHTGCSLLNIFFLDLKFFIFFSFGVVKIAETKYINPYRLDPFMSDENADGLHCT